MSVAAWVTDLIDIDLDPTGTGSYAALGGGAAGLAADTDFYVQGAAIPSCLSKAAWTNAAKGMVNDTDGIPWSIPTDGVLLLWGVYTAQGSLDTKANGGFRIIAGSALSAYKSYYCGGKDTLIFESWVPYVVDPDTATHDAQVGTPSGTWNIFGMVAYLPTTSGPTKGNPIGIDALRYGRHTLEYTGGTGADPDSTFALTEAYANALARRWGNIEYNKGSYFVQGFHSWGTAAAALVMTDSNVGIFIRAAGANNETNDAVTTGYTRFELLNASSILTLDNVKFQALGTRARGVFVHTAGTWNLTNCQFVDVDTFTLLASSIMTDCTFRGTNAITAPGSDLSGSKVIEPTIAADTSVVIWNVNADPDTDTNDMEFSKGANAHHAIEFGTTSPLTMTLRDIAFSGYNASDAQNDSTLHIKRTSGTVTINLIGCSGNISYKSAGATVNLVINPVTTLVTVQDSITKAAIQYAAVFIKAKDGTGPLPFEDIVTITRVGTVATVSHTAHGLSTNQKVEIIGANQDEYNRIKIITKIDANSYSYAVYGSPTTPATGTIKSTGVLISGETDVSGQISDNRTLSGDQPFTGDVKKGNFSPTYVAAPLDGSIDSSAGINITVPMVSDS